MPTRRISPSPEQEAAIGRMGSAGGPQNASEAVREVLEGRRQRRRKDAKLKALRVQIKAGIESLDHGNFTEVDDAELVAHLEAC